MESYQIKKDRQSKLLEFLGLINEDSIFPNLTHPDNFFRMGKIRKDEVLGQGRIFWRILESLDYIYTERDLNGLKKMMQQDELALSLTKRPRRNRKSAAIRALTQETALHPSDFVSPLFLREGVGQRQEIASMPGVYRLTKDELLKEAEMLYRLGVRAVDLFAVIAPEKKDSYASEAFREESLLYEAIASLKREIPELCVMVDVALDPFTDHGHDGLVDESGRILNDATLHALGKMSVFAAAAGADIVAPSDMMDGRVGFIRNQLDQAGFQDVGILAYAAKYASAFYGPFRDALQSSPKFGDKKTYQMNPANVREALLECALDESEGADMLLIKPALPYLDVIAKVKAQTYLPVGAYHVSGEYSMVMAAAQQGWLDADRVFMESLMSIKRAGADFILTYAAHRMAALLSNSPLSH